MAKVCRTCTSNPAVACWGCARAVAIGDWQGIERPVPVDSAAARCALCDTGAREMCPMCWMTKTAELHVQRVKAGAYRGLGPAAAPPSSLPASPGG